MTTPRISETQKSHGSGLFIRRLTIVFLLIVTLSLGACNSLGNLSRFEVGMIEFGGINQARASFGTLIGRKLWHESLEAGEALVLDFSAEINKGGLTIQIVSPEGSVIWELDLKEGDRVDSSVELVANDSGRYSIVVWGRKAGGSYDLSWRVEEAAGKALVR